MANRNLYSFVQKDIFIYSFGCCNIKIWLYKLSQVILLEKAGNRLQCSPRRSNHLEHCRRYHLSGIMLKRIINYKQIYLRTLG